MVASVVYIGLCNPKSPTNVGGVLRAAGCYGANKIWYTGARYGHASKYQTDTKNIASHIPLLPSTDLIAEAEEGIDIVCVELAEGATPLPDFVHPERAMYIFGPEDSSISQSLIDRAQAVVYIPTVGCMNLAATVNVVLYDRLAKSNHSLDHEARIKKSRDVNNRLVVSHKK